VQTIQTQRQAYEAAAAELEKTAKAIRGLLATLERKRQEEASRAKAQGREAQPYAGDFARGQGQLAWPVRGSVVGRFGNEVHPKWGTITPNNGIDIECAIGTPVHVVAKGRVDYVSEDYGTYGQMILVNPPTASPCTGTCPRSACPSATRCQTGAVIGQSGRQRLAQGPDPSLRSAQGQHAARSPGLAAVARRACCRRPHGACILRAWRFPDSPN
jgi:hypothetical protein